MKLVSSKRVGVQRVYDIEVNKTHNFVANGIVVHNCTSTGAQNFFRRAKPRSIVDIAALTSIYRPGPLAAKVDELWTKHEHEPYDWGHPLVNETLKETRGCLTGEMLISTSIGNIEICKIVEDQMIGLSVSSFNETTGEVEDDVIVAAIETGVMDIIEIDTEEGILRLTPDHLVFTQRGWIQAGDLCDSDVLHILST